MTQVLRKTSNTTENKAKSTCTWQNNLTNRANVLLNPKEILIIFTYNFTYKNLYYFSELYVHLIIFTPPPSQIYSPLIQLPLLSPSPYTYLNPSTTVSWLYGLLLEGGQFIRSYIRETWPLSCSHQLLKLCNSLSSVGFQGQLPAPSWALAYRVWLLSQSLLSS